MFFMRIKSIKSIKSTKRETNDFLLLRWFYVHKNAVFFVSHTKNHKKHKKHTKSIKTQITKQGTFLTLDVFYAHKNAAFFVFFRLLLTCTTVNLSMASYLCALIFIYDHLWGSFLFMRIFFSKKTFKGSNISLTESLTQKRVDILNEARNKHGFRNVWSADGKIFYVGDDDKIKNYLEWTHAVSGGWKEILLRIWRKK